MIKTVTALAMAISTAVTGAPAFAVGPDILKEWSSIKAPPPPSIKEVTVDPKTTALLSLDFNAKSCTPSGRARCAAIIPNAVDLLERARAKGMFVAHTATSNMKDDDFVKELFPKSGEPILRGRGDKFIGSDLEKILKDKGIKTVIVIGTAGNNAVLYTALGAAQRNFKAIVPIDTMPSDEPYMEQFAIWQIANGSQLREGATLSRSDMVKF